MESLSPLAQRLEAQAVAPIESTIPIGMTIESWRRRRRAARPTRRPVLERALALLRMLVPLQPATCDHLHDTMTRYDPLTKTLSFLLVCRDCGTERLIDSLSYAPSPRLDYVARRPVRAA